MRNVQLFSKSRKYWKLKYVNIFNLVANLYSNLGFLSMIFNCHKLSVKMLNRFKILEVEDRKINI